MAKLSFFTKASYGTGNFAANLMNCTVGTYIAFYYTEIAGLPMAAVGVILLLCRIFDGVTDLFMGMVVENTKSRHGKARFWLLTMAIPYGVAIFLMFFSPDWGITGKVLYAGATYLAGIAIVYTAISVPYNTLCALMTQSQQERTELATMRQFFGFMGPLAITTLTLPLINFLGNTQAAWSTVALIYGALGAAFYLLVFFTSRELPTEETKQSQQGESSQVDTGAQAEAAQLKQGFLKRNMKSLAALKSNNYWFIVLGIALVIFGMYGVKGTLSVYYAKYIFGDSNFFSLMAIASQVPNIALCFVIPSLASKFGKRNISLIGAVIAAIGGLLMYIDPESLTVVLISQFIYTAGLAPISICVFAMLADTSTYGIWKTNVHNEGLIFSANTFAEKVGMALGSSLTAFALAAAGFVGNSVEQTDSAISSMINMMILMPAGIALIVAVLLFFYRLDTLYPTIVRDLAMRNAQEQKEASVAKSE